MLIPDPVTLTRIVDGFITGVVSEEECLADLAAYCNGEWPPGFYLAEGRDRLEWIGRTDADGQKLFVGQRVMVKGLGFARVGGRCDITGGALVKRDDSTGGYQAVDTELIWAG
ncbi:hypothetical protein AB0G06_43530 [Nonomuraea dietziae]|uniref:hypothetical protein n=1 Tax=Nonomuraea dietziae TaxID=65515 RepID=UPI0033D090B1